MKKFILFLSIFTQTILIQAAQKNYKEELAMILKADSKLEETRKYLVSRTGKVCPIKLMGLANDGYALLLSRYNQESKEFLETEYIQQKQQINNALKALCQKYNVEQKSMVEQN